MKEYKLQGFQIRKLCLFVLILFFYPTSGLFLKAATDSLTTSFIVETYDGLELPVQLKYPSEPYKKLVIFIHGSTPYNELGYIGPGWDENGKILKMKNRFYFKFLEAMPLKDYAVATMAKRSFVYPHRIPRPSLDELALDIQFLIWELKKKDLLKSEDDLVIIGYSEGSTVASKVLGLLKKQPAACVLLGSASDAFNFITGSWQDWPRAKFFKSKNWNDEKIEAEFKRFGSMITGLLDMDEEKFETEFKQSNGFAPWESYHIDKEIMFYDPTANLLASNIPILICTGENDGAMPVALAERTFNRLKQNGYEKATFRVINDEVHQYNKYDVFAIMDAWIESGGATTEYVLNQSDKNLIEKFALQDEIINMISGLPSGGGAPEKALNSFTKAKAAQLQEPHSWFKLGLALFGDGNLQQALFSFKQASDTSYAANFAAMAWIGHIKDLQNERAEAVEWYKKALDEKPGFPMQHRQWNMKIDRSWIEERLKTPFKGIQEKE